MIRMAAVGLPLLAAAFLYFLFDPSTAGFFPRCPSLALTGYRCPGCGAQRALHQLLHLHPVEAMRYNFLLVLYLPYLAYGAYMEYFGGRRRFPAAYRRFFGRRAVWINAALIASYTVLRNLVNI